MSFFYFEEAKDRPQPVRSKLVGKVPADVLQSMGCKGCPRDKAKGLTSPKMEPTGERGADIYVLSGMPSQEDDETGRHLADNMGREIKGKLGRLCEQSRFGYIAQCGGADLGDVEIVCCRNRVVADIEAVKPKVVVGIGDAVLAWATGITGSAVASRGTPMPVKIGRHVCWFVAFLTPNYVMRKSRSKSEYELALEHDVRVVRGLLDSRIKPAFKDGGYSDGIEVIDGTGAGDLPRLERALADLASEPMSAVDIETNGLRPYMLPEPKILTAAVGTFKRTVAFAVDHPAGWGTKARSRKIHAMFAEYLAFSGRKAAHNLAFELEWFHKFYGPDVLMRTEWDDTMALAFVLDGRSGVKSLDYQVRTAFGFGLKSLSNIDTKRIAEYPLQQVLRYNGMDAKWCDALRTARYPEVAANAAYLSDYDRIVRLAPSLVMTETKGLPANMEVARAKHKELAARVSGIEDRINKTPEAGQYKRKFGRSLSPSSTDDVLALMRDVLGRGEVKDIGRDGKVRWTTDNEALTKIPGSEVPSAALILEHRVTAKLLSTYVEPITSRSIVCPDGMIRGKYSSMTAVTGRLSADDPNLQNWPKRKDKHIRQIVSHPDLVVLALDYGQIEFRAVGMASEDEEIVKACWTGYDVHKFWAERAVSLWPRIKDRIVKEFSVDWDEKGLKTLRQEMKSLWVFPQLFGAHLSSCRDNLKIPEHVAEELNDEFWGTFRATKKWQERLLKQYEKDLYVAALGGHHRRGPMSRQEIINMPIQGTAAEIVTTAMCALTERAYVEDNPDLQPNLNVHDDLTFLMPPERVKEMMPVIAAEMCKHRYDFVNVPLVVEASLGNSWDDLKEVAVFRSNEIYNLRNPYE